MIETRRNFLAKAFLTGFGASLLYPVSQANAQTPHPEIYGLDALKHYIYQLQENYLLIHQKLFDGKIGNKSVEMRTNGMVFYEFISLDTEIRLNENGSELELKCCDYSIKGYIDDQQPWGTGISFQTRTNDEIECGVVEESGQYDFFHYRRLEKGKEPSPDDIVHYKHKGFVLDGEANFSEPHFRYPYFSGVYKPSEGNFWKAQEAISRRSQQGFRYAHGVYTETLQQVILELEKQGKLILPR